MEAEMLKRQQILAASSTDDITLLSKRKSPRSPHRFSDIPIQSMPDDIFGDSSFLKRPGLHNKFNLGSTPPVHSRSRKTGKSGQGGKTPDRATVQKRANTPAVIRATDIDSGLSVLVPQTDSDTSSRTVTPMRTTNRATVHEEVVQPASNRRPVTVVCTNFDEQQPLALSQESVDSLRQKRKNSIPQTDKVDVAILKEKFDTQVQHNGTHTSGRSTIDTQAKTRTGVRRKNSTENSDSGRESMMELADNGVPEVPSTSF